ncbi:MAG: 8-oxoguanine DNA glycosylase [Clostridia bacterium]|nr:8-oxoguanine DNA glycosylase [Clostridia bacterium]
MRVYEKSGGVVLEDAAWFDPAIIFDCGQCFRFVPKGDAFCGVAFGRALSVKKDGEDVHLFPCTMGEFESIWRRYFDFDRDYEALCASVCENDARLKEAAPCCKGLRILRQEPFETLISFIISANNNIARIRSVIEKLCAAYGEKIEAPWGDAYAFPTAEALASASVEELRALGLGYRDQYVKKTAMAVASDPQILSQIPTMDLDAARKALCQFHGVGNKVADCILLFSMDKTAAFPKDVWIRRVAQEVYGCDCDTLAARYGDAAGFAQQMMFYSARWKKF